MPVSTKALLIGSALSGLMAGSSTPLTAHGARLNAPEASAVISPQDTGDRAPVHGGKSAAKSKKEKHACKGQNSCKGKGGCGTTKDKNDCKGKGECRTDGKPMGPSK